MEEFSLDKLTPAHWIELENISKNLVSFDERYQAPEAEFAILDELESWGLVQSRSSQEHHYILYYVLTENGQAILDNRI